jgi:hypothetical protein
VAEQEAQGLGEVGVPGAPVPEEPPVEGEPVPPPPPPAEPEVPPEPEVPVDLPG